MSNPLFLVVIVKKARLPWRPLCNRSFLHGSHLKDFPFLNTRALLLPKSCQMGTNSNQKCCLLFCAEQIGIKLAWSAWRYLPFLNHATLKSCFRNLQPSGPMDVLRFINHPSDWENIVKCVVLFHYFFDWTPPTEIYKLQMFKWFPVRHLSHLSSKVKQMLLSVTISIAIQRSFFLSSQRSHKSENWFQNLQIRY